MRPTRWTVHWTLHFCFAKTLHFVRGSIFKSLYYLSQQKKSPVTNLSVRFRRSADLPLTAEAEIKIPTRVSGSDSKIKFTADLPDGLKLSDIDFTVKVVNYCQKDVAKNYQKADCISVDDGTSYVVLADTSELGIGIYMLRLTVHIPDTDYPGGTRKEVIKINPQIKVIG